VARSNQMKIIDIILKVNPNTTAGEAAKAYKVLKELEKNNG